MHCASPLSSSLQRLTDERVVTDLGQMAYQAGNPWLQPKPVWSRCSLRMPQALLGRFKGVLLRSRDLQIPDLKFLSKLFWLRPMGLASRAGSMALLTLFEGKGSHLKQWLVMLLSTPDGCLRFSLVKRQMPGNLLYCPWCTPHHPYHLPYSE